MTAYKDKPFCTQSTCIHFGVDCDRSLTPEVRQDAALWWTDLMGNEDVPIWIYDDKQPCYEDKEDEREDEND